MIHIYTGDGKGKSTAAAGLALRGIGAGMTVLFVQLLKDGSSSETAMLSKLGAKVRCCSTGGKFTFQMSDEEKSSAAADIVSTLNQCAEIMSAGSADMIVVDEFFGAYSSGLIDNDLAERIVGSVPENVELVLTGRNAPDSFVSRADYVTVMDKVKHPFDRGITARRGIEY